MKVCKCCGIEKSFNDFYKNNAANDGLTYDCKSCRKQKNEKYRSAHKKESKPRMQGFRKLPDNMRKCGTCKEIKPSTDFYTDSKRASGVSNSCKKCTSDYHRKRRKEKGEELLDVRRRWREDNRDNLRIQDKVYREKYADRRNLSEARRRARKKSLPDTLTEKDYKGIIDFFDGKCSISDEPFEHMDHFIPLNCEVVGTVKENIIPLSSRLNTSKRDRNPFEWAETYLSDAEKDNFKKVVQYLAQLNGLSVEEYRQFVFSCFKNKNL